MEAIREALDDYQNEKPDDVSYLFEEFKVIEDYTKREREPD